MKIEMGNLSFEQILALVKKLSGKDKVRLSKELEREIVNKKLITLL